MTIVEVEYRGAVAVIWMTDSSRRNALSVALVTELLEALQSTQIAGSRAVVIASREKAFCAGADIRDMLDSGWLQHDHGASAPITPPDLFEALEQDRRPIIAAVDALALGGGVELCLACDLVVATPTASFMFPELALGVLPNTAIARLPEMIGARAARDLILTRRRVPADEALRLGLISAVVDEQSAVGAAVATAGAIVDGAPPAALAAAKRLLNRGADWNAIRAILREMDPDEWREGTTAFLEKRRAEYERFWTVGGESNPTSED